MKDQFAKCLMDKKLFARGSLGLTRFFRVIHANLDSLNLLFAYFIPASV